MRSTGNAASDQDEPWCVLWSSVQSSLYFVPGLLLSVQALGPLKLGSDIVCCVADPEFL